MSEKWLFLLSFFDMFKAMMLFGAFIQGFTASMDLIEPPPYLYKILSRSNWQAIRGQEAVVLSAEDNPFIHFSTAEQLDRILEKYWADVQQFVVLKIDTSRLQGRLQYQSNPGGVAKYYHLYEGAIPVSSVVEAKITLRDPFQKASHRKLEIVEVGDPILRQSARPLTIEEIQSAEIQNLIQEMKSTLRAAPGVGLAAPQIGRPVQLIVIEDMDHSHLTQEQLIEKERNKVPFHVLINPKLFIEGKETAQFFEGCLSVPSLIGVVPRAKTVRVECLNELGQPVVIHATGWYARILQHEIDHLNRTLYIDRVLRATLTTQENYFI